MVYSLFSFLSTRPQFPNDPEQQRELEVLGQCWWHFVFPVTDPAGLNVRAVWQWLEQQPGFLRRGSYDELENVAADRIDPRKLMALPAGCLLADSGAECSPGNPRRATNPAIPEPQGSADSESTLGDWCVPSSQRGSARSGDASRSSTPSTPNRPNHRRAPNRPRSQGNSASAANSGNPRQPVNLAAYRQVQAVLAGPGRERLLLSFMLQALALDAQSKAYQTPTAAYEELEASAVAWLDRFHPKWRQLAEQGLREAHRQGKPYCVPPAPPAGTSESPDSPSS